MVGMSGAADRARGPEVITIRSLPSWWWVRKSDSPPQPALMCPAAGRRSAAPRRGSPPAPAAIPKAPPSMQAEEVRRWSRARCCRSCRAAGSAFTQATYSSKLRSGRLGATTKAVCTVPVRVIGAKSVRGSKGRRRKVSTGCTVEALGAKRRVVPSGVACFSASQATVPLAPARFSMTMFFRCRAGAASRR